METMPDPACAAPPGTRPGGSRPVEVLGGRTAVKPTPDLRRARIISWLARTLAVVCDRRRWDLLAGMTMDLPVTGERIAPDLMICPVDETTDGEWLLPASETILVAEVESRSIRLGDPAGERQAQAPPRQGPVLGRPRDETDPRPASAAQGAALDQSREHAVRRRVCAVHGVPLYLATDPEASSLTLYSLPGEEGYRQVTPLPAGGRLDLPEPLGFTLDTAEMPMKRP